MKSEDIKKYEERINELGIMVSNKLNESENQVLNQILEIHAQILNDSVQNSDAESRATAKLELIRDICLLPLYASLILLLTAPLVWLLIIIPLILVLGTYYHKKEKELRSLIKQTQDNSLDYDNLIARLEDYRRIISERIQNNKKLPDAAICLPNVNDFMIANNFINDYLYNNYKDITLIPSHIKMTMILILQQDLKSSSKDLYELLKNAQEKAQNNEYCRKLSSKLLY